MDKKVPKPLICKYYGAYTMARAVEDFVLKHPVKTKVTKETTAIPSETESQPPSKRMKIMSFLEETKFFLGSS